MYMHPDQVARIAADHQLSLRRHAAQWRLGRRSRADRTRQAAHKRPIARNVAVRAPAPGWA
jgi:hypothetical protein